jgi:hypothetical protein
LGGLVALIAALGLVWFATHRAPPPRTEPKPRRLTANPAGNPATDAHISPDGKYLAYADQAGIQLQLIDTGETRTIPQPQGLEYKVTGWSPGSAPSQLRRVPLSGGPSQLALTVHGLTDQRCARAPATLCLVGELTEDRKQLVFTAFDPVKGRGGEVTRIATDNPGRGYNWDLSPDGSWIALQFPAGENRIRLLSLGGGAPRDLLVNGWYGFSAGPDWAPDGKGFHVARSSPRGATLLYIDLKGQPTIVWDQKGGLQTWGVPSPDGRHLAILGYTVDSNVWMIENS